MSSICVRHIYNIYIYIYRHKVWIVTIIDVPNWRLSTNRPHVDQGRMVRDDFFYHNIWSWMVMWLDLKCRMYSQVDCIYHIETALSRRFGGDFSVGDSQKRGWGLCQLKGNAQNAMGFWTKNLKCSAILEYLPLLTVLVTLTIDTHRWRRYNFPKTNVSRCYLPQK